jgi:hypothetical protein
MRRNFTSRSAVMARPDLLIHPGISPQRGQVGPVPVRTDVAFTDARGREKRGLRRAAEKSLERLPVLKDLLGRDEVVLYIAPALTPVSLFEQLTFGWAIYRITLCRLVITNQRLLVLRTDSRGRWLKIVRQVNLGDIAEAQVKGIFSKELRLKYREGKQQRYWRLRGNDAAKLRMLLPLLLGESRGDLAPQGGITPLCPECFHPLAVGVYECENCRLVFKDEKTMVRRSLLIPGGGYFYCKQRVLGVGDFLAEAVILLEVIVLLVALWATAFHPPSNPGELASAGLPGLLSITVFFVGLLVLEKAFTIHHCRRFIREFIPTDRHAQQPGAVGAAVGFGG